MSTLINALPELATESIGWFEGHRILFAQYKTRDSRGYTVDAPSFTLSLKTKAPQKIANGKSASPPSRALPQECWLNWRASRKASAFSHSTSAAKP